MKSMAALVLCVPVLVFGYQEERFQERTRDSTRIFPFLMGPHAPAIDYENIGDYLRRHQQWQQKELRSLWTEMHENGLDALYGVELDPSGERVSIPGKSRPDLLNFYMQLNSFAMSLSDPFIKNIIREKLTERGMDSPSIQYIFSLLEEDILLNINEDVIAPSSKEFMDLLLSQEINFDALRDNLQKQQLTKHDTPLEWSISFLEMLPINTRRVLISYIDEKFSQSVVQGSLRFSSVDPLMEDLEEMLKELNAKNQDIVTLTKEGQIRILEQLEKSQRRNHNREERWSRARKVFKKEKGR